MSRTSTIEVLRSRNFQLCFWSFFFLWTSFDFFILLPLFILKRGGNSVDVGLQIAIFFFPSVLIRPLTGWLLDRIGRLKVLWTGSALMIFTALAFLLLTGPYSAIRFWMAVILFLRGIAFAAFYTAFFTYAVDLSQVENRSRVIGLFGISGLVAHGIAPWMGQLVLDRFDFSGFFLGSGILSAVSLLISAFLKEQRTFEPMAHTGFHAVRSVTVSRRNLIVLPAAFVFGYIVASFSTFAAPYFQHVGDAQVGRFFLFYGFTAGIVRLLFGGVADRYPRWFLVSLFGFVQSVGMFVIVIQPVSSFYLISAVLCGAAHGILFPTMIAMAVDAHPQEFRGIVTSVFTACMELGFSLGSYVQGLAVHYFGYSGMFISNGIMGIALALYVLALRGRKDEMFTAEVAEHAE